MAKVKAYDPFDFSKAKGGYGSKLAFRTPQMSKVMFTPQDRLAQRAAQFNSANSGRPLLNMAVSPYKALAIYFAKLARAGIEGASEFSALNTVASKSATAARKIGAVEKQAYFGLKEAGSILDDIAGKNPAGYSSKLFEDSVRQLFRPGEVDAVFRSFAKIEGLAARGLAGYGDKIVSAGGTRAGVATGINNAITAGRILKRAIGGK